MNVGLVIQEMVIADREIYHTGIEEGAAFLTTTVKLGWGSWLDLRLLSIMLGNS